MIFLQKTLVIALAILLCLFIWFVGPYIAIGSYRPLESALVRIIIISVILLWLFWPLIIRFFISLFQRLRSPFHVHSKERKKAIPEKVKIRFSDAIKTLYYQAASKKKYRLQRFFVKLQKKYIVEDPWFLVIGPESSGKTSLLKESGEKFIYAEHYGLNKTHEIGKTNECNFWISSRAVYVDTAGTFLQLNEVSQEDDLEHKKLLKLIKKKRKKTKINGIFLCVDADWLTTTTVTELKALADGLRVRLFDLSSTLKTTIPVYLYLTKMDLLPGGKCFFSICSEEILQQGLGFSIAEKQNSSDLEQSEMNYNLWAANLNNYILEKLHELPTNEYKKELLSFIEVIGKLKKPLFTLLEQTFPSTQMPYFGKLRQIWFGSTLIIPETEISSITGKLTHEKSYIGETYLPALNATILDKNALFLNHSTHHSVVSIFKKSLLILLTAGLLLFLLSKYTEEKNYISFVEASFNETQRLTKEFPVTNRVSDDLIYVYEQLGYMNLQLLYQQTDLLNPFFERRLINLATQKTYHRHLFKSFWPSIESYVTEQIAEELSASNEDIYNTLKIYLMLGDKENRSQQDVINWFMARFNSFIPAGYTDEDKLIFSYHLNEVFDKDNKDSPISRLDPLLIQHARLKSMEVPISRRVVGKIGGAIHAFPEAQDVNFLTAAGRNASLMLRQKNQKTVSEMIIPAFYTKNSYFNFFLPNLEEAAKELIDEESWVLMGSNKTKIQPATLYDEAKNLYLTEYAEHWQQLMKDITIRQISNLDDAIFLTKQLSELNSPLIHLIHFVANEVDLYAANKTESYQWANQGKPDWMNQLTNGSQQARYRFTSEQTLKERFDPIIKMSQELKDSMNIQSSTLIRLLDEVYNELLVLSAQKQTGSALTEKNNLSQLQMKIMHQPELLKNIVSDLLLQSDSIHFNENKAFLKEEVNSFTSNICNSITNTHYPFNARSKKEIGIDDFVRLFGKEGKIQTFFQKNISHYINQNVDRWTLKPISNNPVTEEMLKSFKNAAVIRDSFFTVSDNFSFSMFVYPVSLSNSVLEATLDIDGQEISYSHGYAIPTRVEWPGPAKGSYVRLSLKKANGDFETFNFTGPWALFHLYDQSKIYVKNNNSRELRIENKNTKDSFVFEIRSTMNEFPLWSKSLRQFSCPKII